LRIFQVEEAFASAAEKTLLGSARFGRLEERTLLATRAAAFFLEELMDRGLIDHVRSVGDHLERQLRTLALKHPVIVEVRGAGLMRGIELRIDATPFIDLARERGLLVNRTNEKVVRLLPPLTISVDDLDQGITILDEVLAAVPAEVHA